MAYPTFVRSRQNPKQRVRTYTIGAFETDTTVNAVGHRIHIMTMARNEVSEVSSLR